MSNISASDLSACFVSSVSLSVLEVLSVCDSVLAVIYESTSAFSSSSPFFIISSLTCLSGSLFLFAALMRVCISAFSLYSSPRSSAFISNSASSSFTLIWYLSIAFLIAFFASFAVMPPTSTDESVYLSGKVL